MGYRGTLDEFGADEAVGLTLAGIYDRVGSAWREPVNAPNGGFTRVALDGVELSALGRHVQRHRQTLHFADARFERETVYAARKKTLTVRSERFLSAATPNLGVIQFSVSCDPGRDRHAAHRHRLQHLGPERPAPAAPQGGPAGHGPARLGRDERAEQTRRGRRSGRLGVRSGDS
ncbi:MAG: hypothetical protein WDM96_11695 [Lacunisphaera sp.]